jgi:hypothetical protein
MITDNGNDTYTVRFYDANGGTPQYETVDLKFPEINGNGTPQDPGNFVFANTGQSLNNYTNLVVPLLEKAYAQANQSGWTGRDGTDAYCLTPGESYNSNGGQGINAGWPYNVFPVLTQNTAKQDPLISQSVFNQAITSGQMVVLDTSTAAGLPEFFQLGSYTAVNDHSYAVVGYNAQSQTYTLYNPWGFAGANSQQTNITSNASVLLQRLTWSQIQVAFADTDIGASAVPSRSVMRGPAGPLNQLTLAPQTDALSATVAGSLAAGDAKGKTTSASIGTLASTKATRKPTLDDSSLPMPAGLRVRYQITVDDALAREGFRSALSHSGGRLPVSRFGV